MICVQETWCDDNYDNSHLLINGFNLHLTNQGNGKGIATYFTNEFQFVDEVNLDMFQMTKFSSTNCHVINIYRSQGSDSSNFISFLDCFTRD